MLYLDHSLTRVHAEEFDSAARRFCAMHQGEDFYMVALGDMVPESFHLSVRTRRDRQESSLMVQIIGDDLGSSILTALEGWWAARLHHPARLAPSPPRRP